MQTAAQSGQVLAKYVIDKATSRFKVQAFATGLLSSFGHNPRIEIRDYDGEIQFLPDTYEKASVRLNVRLVTLEVLDEMKKDDLKKLEQAMYNDVLEVKDFPGVVFESKEIVVQKLGDALVQAHVTGELSFHGVTLTHMFDARVNRSGATLRISGDFLLRQSDYGIKPVSFAGGALRLKDEVRCNFELVARSQE